MFVVSPTNIKTNQIVPSPNIHPHHIGFSPKQDAANKVQTLFIHAVSQKPPGRLP